MAENDEKDDTKPEGSSDAAAGEGEDAATESAASPSAEGAAE